MRISDWSSDVCSSDLLDHLAHDGEAWLQLRDLAGELRIGGVGDLEEIVGIGDRLRCTLQVAGEFVDQLGVVAAAPLQAAQVLAGGLEVVVTAVAEAEIGRASCRERVCQYV